MCVCVWVGEGCVCVWVGVGGEADRLISKEKRMHCIHSHYDTT